MGQRGWNRGRWLVLLLGAMGLFVFLAGGLRLDGGPIRAQSSDDQSLLLQLAQRLLSQQFPTASSNASTAVHLYPGVVVADFPADIPVPASGTVIGSDEHPSYASVPPVPVLIGSTGFSSGPSLASSTPSGSHVDVVLDVPGKANNVTSFYKQALANTEWSASSRQNVGPFGFVSTPPITLPTVFCRSSDSASLSITARDTDGGPVDVRLSFDTGFNPQCQSVPTPAALVGPQPPGFGVLPSLTGPQGVSIYGLGSSGGQARFGTDAIAATAMSVADVHRFYADELTNDGWTMVTSGGDSSLTWSTWAIPGHSDLQGFLYVRDGPAQGQRSLHVEVASTNPSAATTSNGYGYGSVVTVPVTGPTIATPTATPASGH